MSVERSSWYAACLLLASLTLSATQSDQAVIVFNSRSITKPSLVVNECTSERPYYELRRGQLLSLHLMSDISLTDDKTHRCQMIDEDETMFQSPSIYTTPVIVYRDYILNSTKYATKALLGSVGDTGYLMCFFNYNYIYHAATDYATQYYIACTTFIRLADTSLTVPVSQYTSHTIQVTIKEFGNETEELQFNDTSSIFLNFAMAEQENCTYTVIWKVAEFPLTRDTIQQNNSSAVNNESLLAEEEDCSYKFISGDNNFIGLVEKNKYTNISREAGIKLTYTDTATIDYDNLIIRFNVDTKVTPSLVISKCVSEAPHYAMYRRQNITIEIMSDTFLVENLNNCTIGDLLEEPYHYLSEYDKRIQTKEEYGNNKFKTKIFLSNVGKESGYIICPLSFNEVHVEHSNDTDKQNTFIDWITCMAKVTIVDVRRYMYDSERPYISTKIDVSCMSITLITFS